jgi:hypothetical protein
VRRLPRPVVVFHAHCAMTNPGYLVTDPGAAVIGTQNLFVADPSIIPLVTRINTNLPSSMIGKYGDPGFLVWRGGR